MNTNHTNHDDAIDKTLAALKSAAPPAGMEARILQRLQHATAAPAEFRWRDLFTRTALAGAWWRGAISGAAAASLLVGALLLAQHSLRARPEHVRPALSQIAATSNLTPVALPVATTAPARDSHATPCATPRQLQTAHDFHANLCAGCPIHAQVHRAWVGSSTSFAPSHPAPVLPLTAQERALARLVRTADPKLLASLEPEAQAKLAAQEADDFNRFFAPPPASPTSDVNDQNRTAPKEGEQI